MSANPAAVGQAGSLSYGSGPREGMAPLEFGLAWFLVLIFLGARLRALSRA